jgi:hypothetical protein
MAKARRTYIPDEYCFTGVSTEFFDFGEGNDLVEFASVLTRVIPTTEPLR